MSEADSCAPSLATVVVVVVVVLAVKVAVWVVYVLVAVVLVAVLLTVVDVAEVADVVLTVVVDEEVQPPPNDLEVPSHAAHCWSASGLAALSVWTAFIVSTGKRVNTREECPW
jgi:hypothetical protein